MFKSGRCIAFLLCMTMILTACVSEVWNGASFIYDRHELIKKVNDYQILMNTNKLLFLDNQLRSSECFLDIAVFHRDILIAGNLPSEALLRLAKLRLRQLKGYRALYNEIKVRPIPINSLSDTWITTKIRSRILADDSIDPKTFKIVTIDKVVYIMGDIMRDEARRVIDIARHTTEVMEVVSLLKYLRYEGDS